MTFLKQLSNVILRCIIKIKSLNIIYIFENIIWVGFALDGITTKQYICYYYNIDTFLIVILRNLYT